MTELTEILLEDTMMDETCESNKKKTEPIASVHPPEKIILYVRSIRLKTRFGIQSRGLGGWVFNFLVELFHDP